MYAAVALYRAELIRAKTYFYRSKQLLKNVCLVRPRFFVIYTIRSRRCAREKSVRDGVNVDGGGCGYSTYIHSRGDTSIAGVYFSLPAAEPVAVRCLYITYIMYVYTQSFAANNNVRRKSTKKKKSKEKP